jgi:hypothetical protein
MSAFQQRYTPRAKRAVGLAQLDGGMTARSALDAFHTGALRDSEGPIPPPAGAMPLSTAHDCARKIRQQREGRRGGLERAEAQAIRAELGRRLVVSTDRLTKRLERKSRTGTSDEKLADALTKAARAAREVHAYLAAIEAPPKPAPPRSNGNGQQQAPESPAADASPLGSIAADIERADRAAARKSSPNA